MRRLSIGLLYLMVGACASGPIKLDAPGEQRLTDADAVPVSLATNDLERVDKYVIGSRQCLSVWREAGPI